MAHPRDKELADHDFVTESSRTLVCKRCGAKMIIRDMSWHMKYPGIRSGTCAEVQGGNKASS